MAAEDIRVAVILIAIGKRWIVERVRAGGLGRGGRGFERSRPQRGVKLPSSREHAFQRRAQGRKLVSHCSGVRRLVSCRLGVLVFCFAPSVANAESYGERGGAC